MGESGHFPSLLHGTGGKLHLSVVRTSDGSTKHHVCLLESCRTQLCPILHDCCQSCPPGSKGRCKRGCVQERNCQHQIPELGGWKANWKEGIDARICCKNVEEI